MALPQLTPEQRQANLDKAAASRRERAEVKNRLKHSGASIIEVIEQGQRNEVIGKMRVLDLLQSMPGLGQGPRPPADGAPRRSPRAAGSAGWASTRSPRCSASSAAPASQRRRARRRREPARPADRPGRADRGRQGHGRGLRPRAPPGDLDLGLRDHPPAAAGRGRRPALPLRRRRGVRPDGRATGELLEWAVVHGAAPGTAPRARPVEAGAGRGPAGAARDRPAGRAAGPRHHAGGAVRVPQAAVVGGAGQPAGRPGHRDRGGTGRAGWRPRWTSWPPSRSST